MSKSWSSSALTKRPRPESYSNPSTVVGRLVASPSPQPQQLQQLVSHFIYNFCPRIGDSQDKVDRYPPRWVEIIPSLNGRSKLFDTAAYALTTACLGSIDQNDDYKKKSLELKGETIRRLRNAAADPAERFSDHFLAAIICMVLVEVNSFSGGSEDWKEALVTYKYHHPVSHQPQGPVLGWYIHIQGGLAIVEQRGWSMLKTELGRNLILRLRGLGVSAQPENGNKKLINH
jgi:hypothetical protein